MGKAAQRFKHSDVVRAIKASEDGTGRRAKAAEIMPNGIIRIDFGDDPIAEAKATGKLKDWSDV